MTAIAQELDAKLKTLDPETAAPVERLVRDTLLLVERTAAFPGKPTPLFWQKIRADWGSEPFERPPQGTSENREDW